MSAFENRLTFACNQVAEAAAEVLDWLDDSRAIVGIDHVSLLHEFHQAGTAAERLAQAVRRAPAVAFAGPSRAGKTHVITGLVEQDSGRVSMSIHGLRESIDYLKHVAPEGSRRGAAMILRLTAHNERQRRENFPISVRLLSCADIIKILGSAFLASSGDRRKLPSTARLHNIVETARNAPKAATAARLTEEDVWDVRNYFATRFSDEPLIQALTASGYWMQLAELAPALTNHARGELLGPIWGGIHPLGELFALLSGILEELGDGLEAKCALDALLMVDPRTGRLSRRADSILSGETLLKVLKTVDDNIILSNAAGRWVTVGRAGVAALCAEVRLPILAPGSALLNKADLLELPSIDPGEHHPSLGRALQRDGEALGRTFLAAKATYLLDRYTHDHEITSLAVCVDPEAEHLGELPRLLARWIERAQGADPQAREQQETGLFLVLTKMDKELAQRGRDGRERSVDIGGRLRRLLTEELGRDQTWPLEWSPERAFDQVLLVRHPGIKAKHLFEYTADGRAAALKADQRERIERIGEAFAASPDVRRHVANPQAAWREALGLEDGGLSLLAQSIAAVSDLRAKRRQLLASLGELRLEMKERLQRYYVSENHSYQADRRYTGGLHVVRRLRACADQRRFGHLLQALQVSDTEIGDVLQKVALTVAPVRLPDGSNQTAAADDGQPTSSSARRRAAADAYARAAIDAWIDGLRALPASPASRRHLHMSRRALILLVDELIIAANRLGLAERLCDRIELAIDIDGRPASRIAKAAHCAANAIGEFVMQLGFDDIRSNSHPRRLGRSQEPIFPPRQSMPIEAAEGAQTSGRAFEADWMQAILALIEENTSKLRELSISDEQNRTLGRLIRMLDVTV